MMITLDRTRCTRSGACIDMMNGYCIAERDAYPVSDEALCNTCQKCVAICPSRAITVNGTHPDPLDGPAHITSEQLVSLFERRRSTKRFSDEPVARITIERIVAVAKCAPNQNKNITVRVIDDQLLIREIDRRVVAFVKTTYGLIFGFKPLTWFIRILYRDIDTIRRKMEYKSFERVMDENVQAVILVTGNRRVPVTERSAPYLLATMMYMAESLGIGSCLMDSVYLAFRTSAKLRRRFGITDDVFGVLVLGHSAERIRNIPRGYEPDIIWNVPDD
jgi:NAD-dependent dihydropyrimidine dehydrogenase PreA subunit/nitroreductase